MTQCDRIIQYMKDFGSISAVEAMEDLGIMRLASRIADLKKMGVEITARTVKGMNRFGETVHFTRYWMGGQE